MEKENWTWATVIGVAMTTIAAYGGRLFRFVKTSRAERLRLKAEERRHHRKQENIVVSRLSSDVDFLRHELSELRREYTATLMKVSELTGEVRVLTQEADKERNLKHTYRKVANAILLHSKTLEQTLTNAGILFVPLNDSVVQVLR